MAKGMGRLGRTALIDGALPLLAADSTASMTDLADGLGVGRTTLYRHFGDREAMIAEVARLGARMFGDAFLSARPEVGTGLEAVERICTQLFTVPDVLTLLFADNPIITDDTFAEVARERAVAERERAVAERERAVAERERAVAERERSDRAEASRGPSGAESEGDADDLGPGGATTESDDQLEAVIARGQADGSITADVPVGWAAMYVFLTIGSGHLYSVSAGIADRDVRAQALALTIRAVRRTLEAPGT
ncbi:TetR/AcrR family transcriptional regulator [Brevibacterium casei]|uniref:Bacterial regulatory proteins, tetR family n=1 Tax=Brevibacterium casei TaxID=33889 RepID=A0A449CZZ6_9MICO|nr:TetR/AcrR family transcriptional regulator [Brevibacterium casei]MDH5147888.1 TetR/AcrR family transcriptional regulator [Brevibacterium casei]QZE25864.1 TetR/AcrR family transcriptional regulator [Brevibacterium casei]VEW10925.1 Bacterial regulatory proteins, tetR family [Brevibacterium casei]